MNTVQPRSFVSAGNFKARRPPAVFDGRSFFLAAEWNYSRKMEKKSKSLNMPPPIRDTSGKEDVCHMNSTEYSRRGFMRSAAIVSGAGLGAAATPQSPKTRGRMLSMKKARESLGEFLAGLDIIDCHEHVPIEPDRLARAVDVLTLFSLYEYVDATSAGYSPRPGENLFANNLFLDTDVPLDERWEKAWPHLKNIRYGSYFRAPQIALRDIYGIEKLDGATYREATERIRANNTPGLYTRILRERCRIKTCLVQNGKIKGQVPRDLLTPVFVSMPWYQLPDPNFVRSLEAQRGTALPDLDAYIACFEHELEDARAQGAAGCKIAAGLYPDPDRGAAAKSYRDYLDGKAADPILQATLLDVLLTKAAEWDWPVAVHSGVWGDFRMMEPKLLINLVIKYPGTRFDIYHLGMPFVRECLFVAKNFPNAYLDLCWCYVVSQEMTRQTINEILDTVPVNKIHGFGGDYIWGVENVYGHLVMARETLADAFADRIGRGQLDLDDAKHILRLWLHDNPARFYGIG